MMHHRRAFNILPQRAVIDILFRSVALQFKVSGGTSALTLQPVALWFRIASDACMMRKMQLTFFGLIEGDLNCTPL